MTRKLTIHIEAETEGNGQSIHLKADGDYIALDVMNILLCLGRDLGLDTRDWLNLGMAGAAGIDAIGGEVTSVDGMKAEAPVFGDLE